MATLAQARLLDALIDGMDLTTAETVDLLRDHIEPVEWLEGLKHDEDALLESCSQIIDYMLGEKRPYKVMYLFESEKGREAVAKIMKTALVEAGYLTLKDVEDLV